MCIFYAYKLSLKISSKCVHPNYYFYCFECVPRVCPNLSSAPCIGSSNIEVIQFKQNRQCHLPNSKLPVAQKFIFQYRTEIKCTYGVKCLNNFPNLKLAMKKTSSLIRFSLK
jgi:hypothetical protein